MRELLSMLQKNFNDMTDPQIMETLDDMHERIGMLQAMIICGM